MKKVLIVLTLMLTLGMGAQAAAQKHRHTPRGTELVDTTKHNSAVDAFSDTTDTAGVNYFDDEDFDEDEQIKRGISTVFDHLDNEGMWAAVVVPIVAIIIIFLLAPLLIIIAIFYFGVFYDVFNFNIAFIKGFKIALYHAYVIGFNKHT